MRYAKWFGLLLMCSLLCACSLLPQEEEYKSTPMIRAYVQEEYNLGYVQYGDVVVTEVLSCRYMPVSTQQCRFSVGGIYYDKVYVEKGDLVQKGQLLAQLDVAGLEEEIENLERNAAQIERTIANEKEKAALAVSAQRQLLSICADKSRYETAEEVQKAYSDRIASLQEDLSLSNMRLAEAYEKLAARSLYAEIDGAVTFVRRIDNGTRSVEGELVVSIADASSSVFLTETSNYAMLPVSSVVEITINKRPTAATVVSAESLGLSDVASSSSKKSVYLQLNTPDADLESGDRGSITLTIAKSEGTLFIPEKALQEIGDRTFVYQVDEDGLKRMKDVEIGLVSNRYVEILSGLTEGENVICG